MQVLMMALALSVADIRSQELAIDLSDYNLERQADARHAYRALQRAVSRVCRPRGAVTLREWRSVRVCEQAALADAVWRLDAPLVTLEYDRRHVGR